MNVFCFYVMAEGATLSIESCFSETSEQGFNFTITFTTNRPATYVKWTRDGVLVSEGTRTWLHNAEEVEYKHQFTGSFGGVYKCTIINKFKNLTSDVITIQGEMATFSYSYIRASVDALCRDGTSEISRDPRTKRLQTRRESLAMPSKHTDNNF